MAKSLGTLFYRSFCQRSARCLSTAVTSTSSSQYTLLSDIGNNAFRCTEPNPANHTLEQLSLFYTVPPNEKDNVFKGKALPHYVVEKIETFQEFCIMIRKPVLEIIHYLKHADYSKPLYKFVLYGRHGSGKSVSLSNIVHYASKSDFVIFHVPNLCHWVRNPKEVVTSITRPGFVDLPTRAVDWLNLFKIQNENLLKKLNVCSLNEYVWSRREVTKVGDSLLDIVNLGINRVKYSSDCIAAIATELKQHSINGTFKTLVAIDDFNCLLLKKTAIVSDTKEKMLPEKVTPLAVFLDMVKPDWNNSAAVLVLDSLSVNDLTTLPLEILTRDGFEYLDPFIPVYLPEFSLKETTSMLTYYKDRKWLNYDVNIEELHFLSGGNGKKLMKLCNPL